MKKTGNVLFVSLVIIGSLPLLGGNGNGSGGGNGGASGEAPVDRGDLYGDLYVILRDTNGVPVLDSYGCEQPISATTGYSFQLYTNEAEEIFCELTEEMAQDVINVEFGRLNMGRAPVVVREYAFDEAIREINSATDINRDPAGRLVLTIDGTQKTIDSPRENLALYIKLMTKGHWITTDTSPLAHGNGPTDENGPAEGDGPSDAARPVLSDEAIGLLTNLGLGHLGDATNTNQDLNNDDLLLAASLLAAAADKHSNFSRDEIIYINSIYGINQAGSLPGEVPDKTYFDFTTFCYDRSFVYGQRHDPECLEGSAWTLVPQSDDGIYWKADCQSILDTMLVESVAATINIDGFVQAADDALQVIEFIHNYAVPAPID